MSPYLGVIHPSFHILRQAVVIARFGMTAPTRLHEPLPPPPRPFPFKAHSNSPSLSRPNSFLLYSARLFSRIQLKTNGFRSFSHAMSSDPTEFIVEVKAEEERTDFAKLKQKIETLGVKFESFTPGQYDLLYCPKCKGGRSIQRTLSFHINRSLSYAIWRCFHLECGWAGQVIVDSGKESPRINIHGKANSSSKLSWESFEPLSDELLGYFAERNISKETLQRNNVMQVADGKKIIAFPYIQNGLLVGCKYRTLERKFWQGRNTEKMLYGLDDIADADEIIIVEGEVDKLSVEEAGYCNCVSVPGGAPQTISLKEIPSQDKCKGGESHEKSLSLNITEDGGAALWTCFRAKCGWKGTTRAFAGVKSTYGPMRKTMKIKQPPRIITEESLGLEPLCNELVAYFSERMISGETLRRNAVMQKRTGDQIAIAFTYRRNGELVSCKYRDIIKRFWQEANTEKIFYGLDDINEASDIIIVEGEMDKLAMEEAGFKNCVSVPDGAPPKVTEKALPLEDDDTKYQYLWNCKEYTEKASRIILATDGDAPGQALAEELARRLGRERCWRVKWPKKNDTDSFKDANEVLMYMGPDALREVIENAELYPISGLFNFKDYFDEIDAYYHQSLGFELGVSTGWTALNDLYNVVPGELTIVTGVPNSGKSEWIDALLCNLNHSAGWKFALCSMENKVREHARKLLEKHIKKPFFDVRYAEHVERISAEELEQGKKWLSNSFSLIRCENDCLPNISWVLELARIAVLRHGVNGLVIDPYNELDHQRPPNQTETEYVSQMLTKIKRFAQHHSCHVWFVAHPRQLHNWIGDAPNLYDISGSAHFINKCDNGIVIHRNRDPDVGPVDLVQVCVRKVRNKVIGTIGDAYLSYNRVTGEYGDVDLSALNPKRKS